MKINLLQPLHDKVCDSFIKGKMNYILFDALEIIFKKQSFLFTIYLN